MVHKQVKDTSIRDRNVRERVEFELSNPHWQEHPEEAIKYYQYMLDHNDFKYNMATKDFVEGVILGIKGAMELRNARGK